MTILDRLKTSSQHALSTGRHRLEALQRDHRRNGLYARLGRLCYEERTGDGGDSVSDEITSVIEELTGLDGPDACGSDGSDGSDASGSDGSDGPDASGSDGSDGSDGGDDVHGSDGGDDADDTGDIHGTDDRPVDVTGLHPIEAV